ncbi:MAG: hypothetical protein EOO87_21155, partial [Pedobacter sp.]
MKYKYLFIFIISIILNIVLLREVITHEPDIYKYRVYNRLKLNGWFDKGMALHKLNSDSVAYILTLGQANAGNTSISLDTAGSGVYSYYKGKIYPAADPMIGSESYGGSVWPSVGDSLIKEQLYKKVIYLPLAVGSTDIENWASGASSLLLKKTLEDLKKKNIKLTHIVWHQGESNNGTSKEEYKKNLNKILSVIRNSGQSAPFYCSIASFTPLSKYHVSGIDTNIQQAQIEFINENANVLVGPNT